MCQELFNNIATEGGAVTIDTVLYSDFSGSSTSIPLVSVTDSYFTSNIVNVSFIDTIVDHEFQSNSFGAHRSRNSYTKQQKLNYDDMFESPIKDALEMLQLIDNNGHVYSTFKAEVEYMLEHKDRFLPSIGNNVRSNQRDLQYRKPRHLQSTLPNQTEIDKAINDILDNRVDSNDVSEFSLGGGLQIRDVDYCAISNNVFEENKADFGGAIYSLRSFLTVSDNSFTANVAQNGGGGLYWTVSDLDKVELAGNVESDNSARYGDFVATQSVSMRVEVVYPNLTVPSHPLTSIASGETIRSILVSILDKFGSIVNLTDNNIVFATPTNGTDVSLAGTTSSITESGNCCHECNSFQVNLCSAAWLQ